MHVEFQLAPSGSSPLCRHDLAFLPRDGDIVYTPNGKRWEVVGPVVFDLEPGANAEVVVLLKPRNQEV
jgi:hypothetical protein